LHTIPHFIAMIYTSGQGETKSSCYKNKPHPAAHKNNRLATKTYKLQFYRSFYTGVKLGL